MRRGTAGDRTGAVQSVWHVPLSGCDVHAAPVIRGGAGLGRERHALEPFTRLDRLYERATGTAPFALPQRWLDARPRLDLSTRANFVTTNDIVGGNSGSPMVNAAGDIVGLVFDGNIHSISGSYWFDAEKNRTVAVHPQFMRAALQQVYPVERLARELRAPAQ